MADPWYASSADSDSLPDEYVWERLRNRRNARLAESDWTQTLDAKVDQTAWADYRQALRDLPASVTDPRKTVWPIAPAS